MSHQIILIKSETKALIPVVAQVASQEEGELGSFLKNILNIILNFLIGFKMLLIVML